MAEEFKIADVFVEFGTKGADQVEKDADKVQEKAKQAEQQEAQRQRRMEQQQQKLSQGQYQRQKDVERFQEKMADAGMGEHSPAQWAAADQRRKQAQEDRLREAQAPKEMTAEQFQSRKTAEATKQKQMDAGQGSHTEADWRAAEQRKVKQAADQERETKDLRREQKVAAVASIQLAKSALGQLPGVNALGSIVQTGIMGGPAAAAGQAAAQGIGYGIAGAQKANPQQFARMEYQADRLQAIIGTKFVPVISWLGNKLEEAGDIVGGKGMQLNNPKYTDFESFRDRLQVAALQGMSDNEGKGERSWDSAKVKFTGEIPDAFRWGYRTIMNALS